MIPFDFEYYKPSSMMEAVDTFRLLNTQGKAPLYFSGGTEIITMARRSHIFTKAVIDIKGIPECNTFKVQNEKLVIGASITLTQLEESKIFPLLGRAARKVADHTVRNKLTVGGNICGKITFREAVLPFLISDSTVVLAGQIGIRNVSINQVFNKTLNLEKGGFLVQLVTDIGYSQFPFMSIKKTKQEKSAYPLISIDSLKKDGQIRFAFSGVCPFPFRSASIEQVLNDKNIPLELRINKALSILPTPINNNIEASAEYREFVLENTLSDIIKVLERS
ncbi:FAD binding domain-containing protein [Desulfosporosinus sp. Sb-LF]|uniref:FAD binding domain-containing protein n=1 Tax=Desulfosporosinus sp. Sb-LF TaxID=2560027 RepID=UPI00107F6865|nr:FAD binding domain-containing protein [Desulfosporosinus sp. Sb-LF]TGE34539.1 xanthine dehydrogenase [Desulfosporosinus sp. Sb-LF]